MRVGSVTQDGHTGHNGHNGHTAGLGKLTLRSGGGEQPGGEQGTAGGPATQLTAQPGHTSTSQPRGKTTFRINNYPPE